jgi:hypothetical protein
LWFCLAPEGHRLRLPIPRGLGRLGIGKRRIIARRRAENVFWPYGLGGQWLSE